MSGLPPNWAQVRIGDVIDLAPKNDVPDDLEAGFVPLHLMGTHYLDTPKFETRMWIDIKRGYTHFANDDVLLARITPSFENGKAGIVRNLPNGIGAGSTEYFVCRPLKGFLLSEFLLAYFKTEAFLKNGEQLMSGASGQLRVPKSYILETEIPLPPFNEQQRITNMLDVLLARVDACRTHLERVPNLLKRFRQAVLSAATSGLLTEEWRLDKGIQVETHRFDFSESDCFGSYEFPVSWDAGRLGQIAEVTGGITKDSKKQNPEDEEVPYLRVANVQRGYLDLREMKTIHVPFNRIQELRLLPGDILLNEGGDLDKLGRGWVWSGEIDPCVFQNHVFRARLHDSNFAPKFFSLYSNSRGYDYFLANGKQTTNLASINKSLIENLPIVIPPYEEQHEIVRQVETLFAYADRLEAHYQEALSKIEGLTPSLLTKAFRGELVPQDPNEEPASILLERIREAKAVQAAQPKKIVRRPKMDKTTSKKREEPVKPEEIVQALQMAGKELSTKDLFEAVGYLKDAESDKLEDFFIAVREVLGQEVTRERREDEDWFALRDRGSAK